MFRKQSITPVYDFEDDMDDALELVPIELRPLVPGFLERRKAEVADLTIMLKNREFQRIKDVAHKLKGVGAGYGFQLISDIGRDLEIAAMKRDVRGVEEYVEELARIVENLSHILSSSQNA